MNPLSKYKLFWVNHTFHNILRIKSGRKFLIVNRRSLFKVVATDTNREGKCENYKKSYYIQRLSTNRPIKVTHSHESDIEK